MSVMKKPPIKFKNLGLPVMSEAGGTKNTLVRLFPGVSHRVARHVLLVLKCLLTERTSERLHTIVSLSMSLTVPRVAKLSSANITLGRFGGYFVFFRMKF